MNIIKKLLHNTFGDGFFGLERDQNTQEEITNGYREYQKKHKKPEGTCYSILCGDGIGTCTLYESPRIYVGSCASISNTSGQSNTAIGHNGLSSSHNESFIESHYE